MLQFVPDRAAAVAEMARVVKPGGLVAAAMWDFTGGFSFLRVFADTVAATEPDGESFRARFWADPVGTPGHLRALFEQSGLEQVDERDIMIRQRFANFADWWGPWAEGGQGIAGAFVATSVIFLGLSFPISMELLVGYSTVGMLVALATLEYTPNRKCMLVK